MRNYIPYNTIKQPYLYLGLKGVCGGFMAAFIATLLSFLICYNPWFSLPETPDTVGLISWEDSRVYMCVALTLGLNMIGLPIGFLVGLSQADRSVLDEGADEA